MLKLCGHLFYTELQLLFRRSQEWLYPICFFLIVISLFPLGLTPDPAFSQKYLPGCIWIAALLASLLSVHAVFHADLEDGHLEQQLLSEAPMALQVLAKLSAQWLVTQFPLILLTPLLGTLLHLPLSTIGALTLGLLLGTPILTLLGSFGVALTIGLRQQGVLLGLLFLPLATPVLILGVVMVQQQTAGLPLTGPAAFLGGLFVLAACLLPWTIAGSLRISLDD